MYYIARLEKTGKTIAFLIAYLPMKRIILLLFVVNSVVHAQKPQSVLKFPFLGHPVAEFKDSLLCKDAHIFDKPHSPESKCMSYMVTPSTAVYRYGGIGFPFVIIFPDSTGVIRSFVHMRSYLKDSIVSGPKDDIRALCDHFNRLCNMKGSKTKIKNAYEDSQSTTWKKEGVKITIRWSKVQKRKNVRLESTLDLYIEEEK